jgi:CNT family concentrative nucleoside transporter
MGVVDGHNASPQQGVSPNPDPVLDFANEHIHEHLHHGGAAANHANHSHEVVYSDTTQTGLYSKADVFATGEKSVGTGTDEESGNVVGQLSDEKEHPGRWDASTFIRRHHRAFKIIIHAVTWIVFTA